jgi:hypothetical protein
VVGRLLLASLTSAVDVDMFHSSWSAKQDRPGRPVRLGGIITMVLIGGWDEACTIRKLMVRRVDKLIRMPLDGDQQLCGHSD